MPPLEDMVKHVNAANGSAFALDFKIIAAGLEDAANRIRKLEFKNNG